MNNSIFIFTFSPIQPFISESRRAADLYTSSQILVKLASAAAAEIKKPDELIYPVQLKGDVPNKIVAQVDYTKADDLGKKAKEALNNKWKDITNEARVQLLKHDPSPDPTWKRIWDRQVTDVWDCYWVAVLLEKDHDWTKGCPDNEIYRRTMDMANRALESVKRTRNFSGPDPDKLETGFKDTLSGKRSALHTDQTDGRTYWAALSKSKKIEASKLRPDGKERLDTIGAVKRFCTIADKPFPSTSGMATRDYVANIRKNAEKRPYLQEYNDCVDKLGCFWVSPDPVWHFDGDLLFMEMLDKKRLEADYGLKDVPQENINDAKEKLKALQKIAGKPSPYYTLIALDGDSMGERVSKCKSKEENQELSRKLDEFSTTMRKTEPEFLGELIYNGGDDVMAMAPLSSAIQFANEIAFQFFNITKGTASAGIVISHHQSPLSHAIHELHEAEKMAKKIPGKNAVCITVIKRGGAPYSVKSHWGDEKKFFDEKAEDGKSDNPFNLIKLFGNDLVSSKFAYDVLDESRTIAVLPGDADKAMLTRLIKRHKQNDTLDDKAWVKQLSDWSKMINWKDKDTNSGLENLGKWLILARFIAQGGDKE